MIFVFDYSLDYKYMMMDDLMHKLFINSSKGNEMEV